MPELLESHEPDFDDFTSAFIDKFEGSDVMNGLVERAGLSEQDALAWTVMVQASGHISGARSRGEEAQGLSFWHQLLRKQCSATYRELREAHPFASRDELNALPELSQLNAVRRGVGMAMRRSYGYAHRSRQ